MGTMYHKYITAGKCGQCGKENDRKDRKTCSECGKKNSDYQNETKRFMLEIGICPICKKYRILGGERSCPECRAKEAEYKTKLRERDREKYNNYMKSYQKAQYQERKNKGICTRCGKRKVTSGSRCDYCKAKTQTGILVTENGKERVKNGLCYWCGEKQKQGYKVCEKHYQMNLEKARNKKAEEARKQIAKNGFLY